MMSWWSQHCDVIVILRNFGNDQSWSQLGYTDQSTKFADHITYMESKNFIENLKYSYTNNITIKKTQKIQPNNQLT